MCDPVYFWVWHAKGCEPVLWILIVLRQDVCHKHMFTPRACLCLSATSTFKMRQTLLRGWIVAAVKSAVHTDRETLCFKMKAAFSISPTSIIHPETTALVWCAVVHAWTSVPQPTVSCMLGRSRACISIFKRKMPLLWIVRIKCSEIRHWPSYMFNAVKPAPLPRVWDWRSLLQRVEPAHAVNVS